MVPSKWTHADQFLGHRNPLPLSHSSAVSRGAASQRSPNQACCPGPGLVVSDVLRFVCRLFVTGLTTAVISVHFARSTAPQHVQGHRQPDRRRGHPGEAELVRTERRGGSSRCWDKLSQDRLRSTGRGADAAAPALDAVEELWGTALPRSIGD